MRAFTDVAATIFSAAVALTAGLLTTMFLGPVAGIAVGLMTFGLINNAINFVYYTFISDGQSNLSNDSFNKGLLNRWDRLDYAKQQTQESWYNINAWRFYSEYDSHMYAWYLTGWANEKGIFLLSEIAGHAQNVDIEDDRWDDRWYINIPIGFFGILGI